MKNKSTSHLVLIGLFLVLAFALATRSASAQTPTPTPQTHWTNGGAPNPDWFYARNWDEGVPDSSTDAYVNDGGSALINTPNGGLGATARTLYLGFSQGDSGSLQVDAFLNYPVYLGIFPDCPNNVPGAIYVGYGGAGSLSITNSGVVLTSFGYIAALQNPTRPNSIGTVKIGPALSPCPLPGYDCPSIWHIKPNGCSGAGVYIGCTAPCTPTNGQGGTGLLALESNPNSTLGNLSTLEVDGNNVDAPAVNVGLSGTLTGSGFVYVLAGSTQLSETVNVLGTLAPAGALIIHGNLTLYGKAATTFNVRPQASDSDSINVCNNASSCGGGVDDPLAGNAALDGRVSVTMTGSGFTPGATYTLLHADAGLHGTQFFSESIKYPPGSCFTPEIKYVDAYNVILYLKPIPTCH